MRLLRAELSSYRDCSRRRERIGGGGTRWSRIWTARGGRDAAPRDGRSVVVEVAMNAAMAIAEIKRRRPTWTLAKSPLRINSCPPFGVLVGNRTRVAVSLKYCVHSNSNGEVDRASE